MSMKFTTAAEDARNEMRMRQFQKAAAELARESRNRLLWLIFWGVIVVATLWRVWVTL